MNENIRERFMRLALAEAEKGLGRTSPNPAVGAVVARNGEVLGRGHHERAGGPHAEVNALADVRARGHDPRGATLYVTLEPCNHRGRTPPCTEAVLAAGMAEVVIGTLDPNPKVAGGGAARLADRGLRVVSGVLQDECRRLILPFAKHARCGLPWVMMKAGMSLDGKISRRRGQGGPITGPASARLTHRLRDRLDAILVGVGTALIDDPALTCRLPEDEGPGRDPLRVVLDSRLRLPPDSRMLTQDSPAETWIFRAPDAEAEREARLAEAGARIFRVPRNPAGTSGLDLRAVLEHLGASGICSVLVEGGARVHAAFLSAGLVDEVTLFVAPSFIGASGMPLLADAADAPRAFAGLPGPPLRRVETRLLDDAKKGADILVHAFAVDPADLFAGPSGSR